MHLFVVGRLSARRAGEVGAWARPSGVRYGAKCAAKDWSSEVVERGKHKYEVAQGFTPAIVTRWCRKQREAIWQMCEIFSERPPDEAWFSDTKANRHGPPVICMSWT